MPHRSLITLTRRIPVTVIATLLTVLALSTFSTRASAETTVPDTVTTTTWTAENSPYRVIGTVTIPAGNTLTIEAGVDVLFDADVQFIVQGAIHTHGTETDSVRFLKGSADQWRGIRISGGDSSAFAYTRISDGNARGSAPDERGGALYVTGSGTRVFMTNCVVSVNTAQFGGGALYSNDFASLTLSNSLIGKNIAEFGGGIFSNISAKIVMTDCAISGNTADYGGGVFNNNSAELVLNNSAITGNTGEYCGGLFNDRSAVATLTNCVISDNVSQYPGSGLYNDRSAVATLKNSILWSNSPSGSQIHCKSGTVNVTYSIVESGTLGVSGTVYYDAETGTTWPGDGNIDADPLFVDAAEDDYRLSTGSPCIDAGDPDSPLDPDGTRADMGAFYFHQNTLLGIIAENTVLYKAESPYMVVDTVVVPSGVTLTVEPGVDVIFKAPVPIIVEGTVSAAGTAQDSIRFAGDMVIDEYGEPRGTPGSGIVIGPGGTGEFAYTRISYMFGDIEFYDGGPYKPSLGGEVDDESLLRLAKGAKTVENGMEDFDPVLTGAVTVYGQDASLAMTNSVIRRNFGMIGGGLFAAIGAEAALENCIIADNFAIMGGGLGVFGATVALTNCTISGNMVEYVGGGIVAVGPDDTPMGLLKITDCTVSGNTTYYSGGGLAVMNMNIDVSGTRFEHNYAYIGGGAYVGGELEADFIGCEFVGNTSEYSSGGLHVSGDYYGGYKIARSERPARGKQRSADRTTAKPAENGEMLRPVVNVSGTLFDGNSALDGYGGGATVISADFTAIDCIITNNYAAEWGGGFEIKNGSTAFLLNCVFDENVAAYDGGAISIWKEMYGLDEPVEVILQDCAVTNNTAANGGGAWIGWGPTVAISGTVFSGNQTATEVQAYMQGAAAIFIDDAAVTMTNCTVAGNHDLLAELGAIVVEGWELPQAPYLMLNSTIIWGNSYRGVYLDGEITDIAHAVYSIVQDGADVGFLGGWPGTGNLDADPLFRNVAANDYRLSSGSPAIDAGDPALPLDPDGSRADIGAFWYQIECSLYGDVTGDETVSAADASKILQYVVHMIDHINFFCADVSGNAFVSAYDAALVLHKVVNPSYVFPVEGGLLPKPAAPPVLTWQRDGESWVLRLNTPSVLGAEFELRVAQGVEISSPALLERATDGDIVRVAYASAGDELEVLRVHTSEPPELIRAMVNDEQTVIARPAVFGLTQNAPNPFNPRTALRFSVAEAGAVRLAIYDVNGREVRTLVDGALPAGHHEVVWDARDNTGRAVASGVYVYRLTSGENVAMRRMVLVR